MAQAEAETQGGGGGNGGELQATAKTTFGGVTVQSAAGPFSFGPGGIAIATAQGGSGQFDPGFVVEALSTALPSTAYATTLIGGASNVADALLGSNDKIFGTAILGLDSAATFDLSFRGDLILGVVTGGSFDIVVNGIDLVSDDYVDDNTVLNLGSTFGPNIDLTIEGEGVFALGGAVPEPSTWAMMLVGLAGLGLAGHCRARGSAARQAA